jgi:N-acetylated-alpha-linked acidic dipeptidase
LTENRSTPGYPSKPGVPRVPVDDATPSIPSIPISYTDALPILKALNGYGPKAKDFNKYWTKNLGLGYKGVDYNVGPSPKDIVLNLYNEVEYTITPLWNVIGVVNGTIPNEVIVVGNHRDAWIAGGAGDPNSGSAVLNEVIRGVGEALKAGWKPWRTIVFASWDGEEYALIGSTEWVEEYLPWITEVNVAYVNVDVGVKGPRFSASAAPLLNRVLREVTHMVPSPNQTIPGSTVGDVWSGNIRTMGSGSDFTAFQDYAGVPCIDMGFGGGDEDAVYHYHSNYDSFYWMSKYGDPGFVYHKTMSQVLGLMVAELSNKIIIQFNATEYANELEKYVDKVEAKLESVIKEPETAEEIFAMRASATVEGPAKGDGDAFRQALNMMRISIGTLKAETTKIDEQAAWAERALLEGLPWWRWWTKIRLGLTIVKVNNAYKQLERNFLYQGGLDGRSWFKHVVFAPGLWTGYAGGEFTVLDLQMVEIKMLTYLLAVFPGLMESIDAKDFINAMKWAAIIDDCIVNAAKSLAS